jgi:cell shape-determining protein MreC
METTKKQTEIKENEIYTLNKENSDLRERLDVLESIVKANKQDYDNLVSANVLSSIHKSSYEFHGGRAGKKDQSID